MADSHKGVGVSWGVRLASLVGVILGLFVVITSVVSLPLLAFVGAWNVVFDLFGGYWPDFTFPPFLSVLEKAPFFDWRGDYMPYPNGLMWVLDTTLSLMGPAFAMAWLLNILTPAYIRIHGVTGLWAQKMDSKNDYQIFLDGLSKKYRGPKARLWVMPISGINAFAMNNGIFGRQSVVMTSEMLMSMHPELVKWILAHEYGHILHGDTKNSTFWLVSIRGIRFFSVFRNMFARLFFRVTLNTKLFRWIAKPLIILVRFIMFCGRIGTNIGTRIFLLFDRWASRRMEFAADHFASIEIGPAEGVYLFQNMKSNFEPLFNNLFATHPTFSQRINQIVKRSKTDAKVAAKAPLPDKKK